MVLLQAQSRTMTAIGAKAEELVEKVRGLVLVSGAAGAARVRAD